MPELPVGSGAGRVQRASRRRAPPAPEHGAQQLPGSRPARELLEPRARQPPHGADDDGLWPARGAERGRGGGSPGALRAPSAARRRAARRRHRARAEPLRQGAARAPPADAHAGARSRRRRRRARAARAPRRLRHRDRCRLRSAARQSVADRYHGVLRASRERPAPVERPRAGAAPRHPARPPRARTGCWSRAARRGRG